MPEIVGRSIICFSNIEWGIWKQRHHHLMERFARRNRVLFVETVGMRSPNLLSSSDLRRIGGRLGRVLQRRAAGGGRPLPSNLSLLSPLVVPFHGIAAVRHLNASLLLRELRRWMGSASAEPPILWVYLPLELILQVTERLPHRLLVYDCVDEITGFRDAPGHLAESETRLIRRAHRIFASSRPLVDKCRPHNPGVCYVPNGGDVERFARDSRRASVPPEVQRLPRPRVGYVGAIREWFHHELLREAAARYSSASFVLVGDDGPGLAPLRGLPNVHLLGPRPYEDLPAYLASLDVCLIPFRHSELIRSTHPIKVYEYLAAGRPVVSTPMEEIAHLQEVDHAEAGEPFLEALGRRLREPPSAEAAERRRRSVQSETWDARFGMVDRELGLALRDGSPRAGRG